MDKVFETNLQASSKKIFILKLIVNEIENQLTETIGCVEPTATKELEFLVEILSKYEKKVDEAMFDDRLLVDSEVDKLTEMMKNLDISK